MNLYQVILIRVALFLNYWGGNVIPCKAKAWCDLTTWRCSTYVALLCKAHIFDDGWQPLHHYLARLVPTCPRVSISLCNSTGAVPGNISL